MRRVLLAAGVAVVAASGVTALATAADEPPPAGEQGVRTPSARTAGAVLRDVDGRIVGQVQFALAGRRTFVTAQLRRGITAGFHGFHVHAVGVCEPPFTSAGGHLAEEGQAHREHVGDLPSLLVEGAGSAYLRVATTKFSPQTLRDGDGSAVIVHAGPDNFANIPERYRGPDGAPGPDAETLRTGDSGGRVACGVVR
jgi:Cu-Zn family superoxide dismutase